MVVQNKTNNFKNKIITIILILLMIIPTFIPTGVFALSDKEQKENINKIGGFLVKEMGLNVSVAFGILGNIEQESGFNPASVNSSSGASGICQWTDGRRAKMIAKCGGGDKWKTDIDGQLLHLKDELNGPYRSSVYNKLKNLPDNETGMKEATDIWCRHFEVCGDYDEEVPKRFKKAQKLYKKLNGKLAGYSAASEGAEDFSIAQETISPVMKLKLSDGSIFCTLPSEKEMRREINLSILHGTAKKTYNLYERFGPKLQFIEYLGESSDNIQLGDHIVSSYYNENLDKINLKEDIISYSSTQYLSTKVYKNRPQALNNELLKSGYKDPRVTLKKEDKTGRLYLLSLAEYRLGITTFLFGVVSLFIGDTFNKTVIETFRWIVTSSAWEGVRTGVAAIMVFFIVAFIISLVKHGVSYSKGGTSKPFFIRALVGILSIGLVSIFLAQPTATLDLATKCITFGDTIINQGLSEAKKDDPVIYSESENNTEIIAAVWETSLFDPWCKAVFNDKYENLYTQYSTSGTKMPQSFVKNPEKLEKSDEVFYNSAKCTGDVWVDKGKGKKERNWAAYALSTTSIYHIDSQVYDPENKSKLSISEIKSFPMAKTTARDKNLYADTFRWVDAKMNISPMYFPGEYDTTSSQGIKGVSSSREDVINGACAWASGIAADNQFHYGYDGDGEGGKNYGAAHSGGCYFCGTSGHKTKSDIIDAEFTYCCNPFVFSAFAHGGGEPTMLAKCEAGKNGSSTEAYYGSSKLWQSMGRLSKDQLEKGDVLIEWFEDGVDGGHAALYIGNGKVAQASGGDDNIKGSKKWNGSISDDGFWNGYNEVFRYVGSGGGLMESHDAIRDNLAFYNYADANQWETHYYKYSWEIFWRGLLLLGLIPVIIKKVKAFLDVMFISIKGIIYALKELLKENTGLHAFWEDFVESFLKYILYSVQLYFLVFLYITLVEKGFLPQIFYLFMCFIITTTKLSDIMWRSQKLVKSVKHLSGA